MRTIQDVLKTKGYSLWSVTPDTTVSNAIKLMADKSIGALPVLEAGRLTGVISEKDCVKKVIEKGENTEEIQVREVITSDIVPASPAQTVDECLETMTKQQIRYLPVLSNGSLVGFVSTSDLFSTMIDDQKDYIFRLENYVLGIGFA